jgi:uncharacterized protein with HEPN domain
MKKKAKIFLLHILNSIEKIEKFTDNISEKQFLKSEIVQDAVIRRLEIIGEAVKNLSKSFKEKYQIVEWKKIAGTRDNLIHEYFGVDLKLTYRILKKDLPKLKKHISDILKDFV